MTRSEHWSSILARLAGMVPLLILLVTAPAAQAQTFTVLHSFTGPEGTNPYSGLIMDHAGRLYGTAYAGGAHGFGTVYRIARAGSGWIATGLYSFQGGMDGAYPAASVTFGPEYSSSRLGNGSCREQFSRE